MYDIANETSFEEAKSIMKEIITVKKDKKTPMMLVGNKLDLEGERQVLRTSGNQLIELFMYRSALNELFMYRLKISSV